MMPFSGFFAFFTVLLSKNYNCYTIIKNNYNCAIFLIWKLFFAKNGIILTYKTLGRIKMKKRSFSTALICLILAIATLFSACDGNAEKQTTTEKADDTSTSSPDLSSEISTENSTKKYSPNQKLIALTFDDGPRSETTGKILDALEQNGGVATFFVVGYNIENNAQVIERASLMGCEIGNHSKDHKTLTQCSDSVIKEQVSAPNEAIKAITGKAPTLFRVPGGAFKGIKSKIGMPLIQWSIDTEDWKYKDASNKNRTSQQRTQDLNTIAETVLSTAQSGDIVLMHDIYDFTADLAQIIIEGLVQKGFKLVTVSELFEAYGIKLEAGSVYRKAEAEVETTTAPVIEKGDYIVGNYYSSVNVHSNADRNSQTVAEISAGEQVTVEESVSGWAYISAKDGTVKGWVLSSLLIK